MKQKSCGCRLKESNLAIGGVYKNYIVEYINKAYAGVRCVVCNTTRKLRQDAVKNKLLNKCTCFSSEKFCDSDRSLQSLYKRQIAVTKRRGKQEFELTYAEFKNVIMAPCLYCNESSKNKSYERIGIDRIDSSKGYVAENCAPCCYRCNTAKNNMSIEDFKNHISKIYNFYNLKPKA